MKYKAPRNPVKTREALPKTNRNKKGEFELLCPFCVPTHVLTPNKPSTCGTQVQVKAVQYMITQHTAKQKGIVCMKCHKGTGGEMVACMNGFIHTFDCAPGTVVLSTEPKYDKWAAKVYRLPTSIRKQIEKRMGEVKQIKEIDASGNETGKILGYFFYKNDV
ncbi:MAG: hypothetical protein WC734_06500 [Patescibacteria group bacterium]|jgi:hypothetical protein